MHWNWNDVDFDFSLHFVLFRHSRTGFYRPRKLGHSFPRLYDIVEGEAIATLFLQLNPEQRMGAEDALNHPYFAPLPRKLFELPDGNKPDLTAAQHTPAVCRCVEMELILLFFCFSIPISQKHQYSPLKVCMCIRNQIDKINEN